MKSTKKELGLMLIGTLIAVVLGEVFVRLTSPQPLSGSWRVATETGLLVNKSAGKSRHQRGEHIVHYHFYEPHLRDTPLHGNGLKILTLGDSFTFGWGLNKEETYVFLLQRHTDATFGPDTYHFLNGAAGGWGTADCLAYAEEFGDRINPDIVLVFLNTDDIGRSIKSGLYRFVNSESMTLTRCEVPVDRIKRAINYAPAYQFVLENSHLVQLLRRSYLAFKYSSREQQRERPYPSEEDEDTVSVPTSLDLNESDQSAVRLGQALFRRLKSWCDKRGVALYITTTGRHDARRRLHSKDPTAAFMRQVVEFFQMEGIPYFDISPSYFALPEKVRASHSFQNDSHPNSRGSRFIADQVWSRFLRNKLKEYSDQHVSRTNGF
jgi:hypothetical protein